MNRASTLPRLIALCLLPAALLPIADGHAEESAVPATITEAAAREAAADAALHDPLGAIQARWAEIRYATPEDDRVKAYEALLAQIGRERQRSPDDTRLLVWEGIVLASQAGAQGGLGALSLVKRAKADFEAVIARDGAILDGSAYTSLGSLYYQVPGWPLGFGNDDKARELLQKGLAAAPDGIDANFFWGDFLLEQEDYDGAVAAFERALAAPPRAGRESADAGRRGEIETALAEARRLLAKG